MSDLASSVISFWGYFAGAIAFCVLFILIYIQMTPHKEFDLIVHQHNASAALAFGMTLLGFAIAIAGVLHNTTSVVEFAIWACMALVAQIIGYWLARLAHPGLSDAIEQNTMAAAIWLGSVSVATGLLSAASMSY